MKFRDLTYQFLSQYKIDVLGIKEDGIFRFRGKDIPKAHILPIGHWNKNILEKYRDRYFSSEHGQIKFHQFFHHLNSSQALCINLFYPLIAENRLGLFLAYLGINSGSDMHSQFEKESDIERPARPTSFDFHTQFDEASHIFVEVKYTEEGFAKAKKDPEHRKKFQETYLPLVRNKAAFLVPACQEETVFLDHYQVLRNLVHVSETDFVVLLFPLANTQVLEEAIYARDHLLTSAGRERLKIVYLEELVSFLEHACEGSTLEGYYQAFRLKYLPGSNKEA